MAAASYLVETLTAGKAAPFFLLLLINPFFMSKFPTPTPGNQPAMPPGIASPTQFQAAQLHELFESLSDVQSESLTGLLSRFTKAVSNKSIADAIYVQGFIAQVKNCLAPHAILLQELSQHYYQVSLQDEKEVALC